MKIFCDVDNTIVDFCGRYAEFYEAEFGVKVVDPYFDYDLKKVFPLVSDKYKYLRDSSFYSGIKFFEGAVEVLENLNRGHEVYFISTCVNLESMVQKFCLLESSFSFFGPKRFITMRDKGFLSVSDSVLIDDAPAVFRSRPNVSYRVCLGHGFNLDLVGSGLIDVWCPDWKSVSSYLDFVLKRKSLDFSVPCSSVL